MKKSNIIITVILVAASAFLLWLWYYLGFNHIDDPLDLVISIIWWVIIIVCIGLVIKTERTRQQKVRTMYLMDGAFYNSELGVRPIPAGASATATVAAALGSLEYGFTRQDAPQGTEQNPTQYRYVVRTEKFEKDSNDASTASAAGTTGAGNDASQTWEGEVVNVATGAVRRFASKQELAAIIG